jgi:phosphonatase-like hydrolase
MTIELVVFDLAGTTVNDADGVNRAVREALAAVGVNVSRDSVNAVMGIPKPVALRYLLEEASREDLLADLSQIHADFVARMIRFYQTDPSVYEIAGATDVFRRLQAAGIKVALDTGFTRDIVDVILPRLGWTDSRLVNFTVTSDEVSRGRPHPDLIQRAMTALGLTDPARVAKVGDTPADLEEGMRAECGMVIGVTQGSHSAEQLRACQHTHLIGTVAELPALLGL